MPINVGILNRRGRERRERPRSAWIPPVRRARARRNFRENYNANSSTLHGYTRNVHRVHSSAEGCYTWSKPTCTVTYIRSPLPRAYPDLASLSSYRCASVALFAYYWRAACRQQAIEIPSLSISRAPSLFVSLSPLAKGETRSRYPLWQKFQYGTPRTVPRGFDVRYFRILSNEIAELHGTKYARNITGGSNATVGNCAGGGQHNAVMPMRKQELTGLLWLELVFATACTFYSYVIYTFLFRPFEV